MADATRIGFIGFGNMAQALAKGLISAGAVQPERVFVCAKHPDKVRRAAQAFGVRACRDAVETVDSAEIVVIAVKPHVVAEVLEPVKERLRGKIVVSVVAGYPFERYEALLPPGIHHLSTMPNTPVAVGEGIIICENRHSLSEEEYRLVEKLFSRIALVQLVETRLMDIAGTLSGCGPAFVCLFVEALADAVVKHGLPRDLSYRLAAQMVAGTGKLQLATGEHPGAMKDAVCSPGGMTIAGVAALEHKGLRSAVISAVDAVAALKKA